MPAANLPKPAPYLENPFNERQVEAFRRSFTDRLFLLWGPPGTGKTTVLAGMILGWLERAWANRSPVSIGVGASNYNAIDNVLREVADLLDRKSRQEEGNRRVVRLAQGQERRSRRPRRRSHRGRGPQHRSRPNTRAGPPLPDDFATVIGGTWMQLGKLAESVTEGRKPVARWFDLLVHRRSVAGRGQQCRRLLSAAQGETPTSSSLGTTGNSDRSTSSRWMTARGACSTASSAS